MQQKSDKIDWTTVLYTKTDSSGRKAIVFGDGTMICTRKVDTTVNITTAWGSLYYGKTNDYYVFSPYSAPDFIEAPTVSYTVTTSANDALLQASWDASSPSNVNASNRWALPTGGIGFVRPNTRSNCAVTINIIAIGRWKA